MAAMVRKGEPLVVYLFLSLAMVDGNICPRASLAESVIGCRDSCSASESPANGVVRFMGVEEGDEDALQKALYMARNSGKEYVAVLFHASWCPFSKICYPNFGLLSYMFPTIWHFSFEESAIRPSILSRYGVHGFPTLFLLNSTMIVRYHGSRALSSLVAFYSDVTGMEAVYSGQSPSVKAAKVSNLAKTGTAAEQENCPFVWAKSPEKILQQDTYLALASSFLLLRLLYCIVPKLHPGVLCERCRAFLQRGKLVFGALSPRKRSDFKEGALHAKSWASMSLASIGFQSASQAR